MTLKRDTKFGEESTFRFKIYMRNLTNFDMSTQKSQKILLLWDPFEQSIYCLRSFMTLKSDAKCEEKLTCGLRNGMKNGNFHQSTQKCQNWDLIGSFYPK